MERALIVIPDNKKMDAKQFAYAPLGPLYIAAVLERDGFDVEVWDLREDFNNLTNPPEKDIYLMTAVTPQIDDMKYLDMKFGILRGEIILILKKIDIGQITQLKKYQEIHHC